VSSATILRRTKSRFFAKDKARDPETLASVAAFTSWRLGLNTIKRMRSAQFEIEANPQYFAFLREYLIFLIQVADRFAFSRLSLSERRVFTVSMVKRLAEQLAENQSRLIGDAHEDVRRGFIDLFNTRADEYAASGFDDSKGPDFSFMRICSHALLAVAAPPDRAWITDQLMSIEAPEAVETLHKLMENVVRTAGSIIAPSEDEAHAGPFPEMPRVDAPLDDPIPPE
jgi:antitoxin component HigA of HigAB toxin-antitoxin module